MREIKPFGLLQAPHFNQVVTEFRGLTTSVGESTPFARLLIADSFTI
jgi:hypothetical protein